MSKEKHGHEARGDPTIETLVSPPVTILSASLSKRFVAGLVDSVIITGVWILALRLLQATSLGFSAANEGYLAVIAFVYYFLLEGSLSSTFGKMIMHLRVVDKEGDQCSYTSALLRNVVRFIDWLQFLYILGIACVLASKNRLRFGDVVAGTIVTTTPEKDINPPPVPFLFH
jgi:uncharacterized RDD family membrane protein YckC